MSWTAPEWPWVVLVSGAWVAVAAHAGHHHPLPPSGWLTMVVAMMLPATLPVTRAVSFGSLWSRRYRAPAIFLASYVGVWAAFGAVALAAWSIAGLEQAIESTTAAAALVLVAAAWQLTPQQNRFLKRCHRTLPLGADGPRADRACARYGAYHASQCLGSCWPLMLTMVPGHQLLALMVSLGALSTWLRLARRPRRRACAAVLTGLAALTFLIR